ncbi:MAG: transglutaminase domain-containing protein [Chloroflexi bacterium]|nr:transglutaminase domain-containing protein [Chloroflexota bacterium]
MTFVLALLTSLVIVLSLEAAHWTEGTADLKAIAIAGGVIGLVVASVRRFLVLPHLLALGLGALLSFNQTLSVVHATTWEGQAVIALKRIDLWWQTLSEGGLSPDQLPLGLAVTFLAWLLAYITVFLAARTQSIWALVPTGFALLSNLTYLPDQFATWLFLYLLAAALLLAWMVFQERRRSWSRAGTATEPWLGFHFVHAVFWLAVAVSFVIVFLPRLDRGPDIFGVAWNALRTPIGGGEGEFRRLFAGLPSKVAVPLYSFGPEMPLLGAIGLSEKEVMLVESDIGLYLQARNYDEYHPWGWRNAPTAIYEAGQESDITSGTGQPGRRVTVGIEIVQPSQSIFYTGTPLKVSIPVAVEETEGAAPGGRGLIDLQSLNLLLPGTRYTVQAAAPNFLPQDLARAPAVYPAWVRERYLQLPPSFPERVRRLAQEVTARASTPYDKARVITIYLRTLKYDQKIAAPPPGADAVESFLFSQKVGYSDYFASAAVTMLRSVGVPARLAVGYHVTEYDPNRQKYVARESDAHAWPEAYFPSFGWVPFEPTPTLAPILSQTAFYEGEETPVNYLELFGPGYDILGEFGGEGGLESLEGLEPFSQPLEPEVFPIFLVLGGVGVILVLLSIPPLSLYWWLGLALPTNPHQAYRRMGLLSFLAGLRRRPWETPQEYGARLGQVDPSVAEAAGAVTTAYSRAQYSANKAAPQEMERVRATWRSLAPHLLNRGLSRLSRVRLPRRPAPQPSS